MAICRGCSGGGGCQCFLEAGTGIDLGGIGTSDDPWIINATGGSQPDYFGLFIDGEDEDLAEPITAGTFGNTRPASLGKNGGGETVNIEPITLGPGEAFSFRGVYCSTVDYLLQVIIYVTSTDCSQKIKAVDNIIPIPNSGAMIENIIFDPGIDWDVFSFGVDVVELALTRPTDDTIDITSTAGGCFSAQMLFTWVEF